MLPPCAPHLMTWNMDRLSGRQRVSQYCGRRGREEREGRQERPSQHREPGTLQGLAVRPEEADVGPAAMGSRKRAFPFAGPEGSLTQSTALPSHGVLRERHSTDPWPHWGLRISRSSENS